MTSEPISKTPFACVGKEAFASGAQAAKVAKAMGRKHRKVEHYRCPICSAYHVGRDHKSLTKFILKSKRRKGAR